MRLVGEGCSSHEALDLARLEAPDVVIMDASLSNETGIEATRTIRRELPQTAVVLLATNEDEELLFRAIKAGAAAFFGQDVLPDDLLSGVRRVCQGEYLINDCVLTRPLTASRVLEQFHTLSEAGEEVDSLFIPVSAREIEVLDYIARGYSNKEIARALKISDQTVKNHITSILKKLAVNDRTQAVVYALRHGWINMQQLG
jgi:DNA-binding NarL/FixJ family response regulator